MAAPVPQYQKLPGRGLAVGESSRAYLAADHILLITATGFSESYRRFYLRDIHCITIRKTKTWPLLNGVYGFFLFWMLIGLVSSETVDEVIGWSVAGGFFLGLLAFNLFRGPTCMCELHTAVQSRRLTAANRVGAARKLIVQIRGAIDAAQGSMPVEEVRLRIDQARQLPGGGASRI